MSRAGLVRLALGAAVVAVVLLALPALVPELDPFREDTEDRSTPVLLRSLEDLSEYRAATANLQVVVDVEHDTDLIPSFVKGDRTTFLATGSVDAAVDFGGLGERADAVRVSGDRRAVTLTLPAPRLTTPRLDVRRSHIVDRDRGLLDRIGEAVGGDDGFDEQEVYGLAEDKLRAAAAADPRLLETARSNTRAMLTGLLRGLGFERITIRFRPPPKV